MEDEHAESSRPLKNTTDGETLPEGPIYSLTVGPVRGQSIAEIARDHAYVKQDARAVEVADALRSNDSIMALGVVDDDDVVVGLVVKDEFFNLMVRPYAREVFKNREVKDLMSDCISFRFDENIYAIAEKVEHQLSRVITTYYVLHNDQNHFVATFSTLDVLMYLSRMTQNDIAFARRLQSRIVRERDIRAGHSFEFAASSRAAKGVGGDFYELKNWDDGKWVLAFCDVSGKGVAAAIISSAIWGMMSVFDFSLGTKTFVGRLNEYVAQTFESEKFVTGIFLEYDERKNHLSICDMGHSHIYLFRDGQLARLKSSAANMPIGVTEEPPIRVDALTPRENDILLIFTDGLTEQVNDEGDEFPFRSVIEVLKSSPQGPVELLSERLLVSFNKFRGKLHLGDDVTFAFMRFAKQELSM
jgi:phosphoserine phosphatase RsbU/P